MSRRISGLPYARAVFEAADENNALDAVYADFKSLWVLFEESKEFSVFIGAKLLESDKTSVLDRIFGESFHSLTLKFLKFLVHKKRFDILRPVVADFFELYRQKKGRAVLDVSSYGPLDTAMMDQIKEKWTHRLGKTIDLNFSVDPSILGGIRFQIKDQVHDYSIETQLEKLREQLLGQI